MADQTEACGASRCGFEGAVEYQSNRYQERAYWQCPDCGTDHDIAWQPGLDNDRWRE
jgi:rubredoxin